MSLVKRILALLAVTIVATLSWENAATATVHDTVTNTQNIVLSVAPTSFKNSELQAAYLHDLEGVNTTLTIAEAENDSTSKNQMYQDALQTVNNLINKTNGCDNNGLTHSEDWITECNDAATVRAALNQLVGEISGLIQ